MSASYRVSRPGEYGWVSVSICYRDPLCHAVLPVGSRATVEHYGPGVTYSTTTYRRVKAGWRVVRPGRLGGLRWRRKGE